MVIALSIRQPGSRIRQFALAGTVLLAVGACAPRVIVHGNVPESDRIAEIVPGTHGRRDVELMLGSPSSVSLFGGETWHYIGGRQETLAFLEPEVVKRSVVKIRFDEAGTVESVDVFGKERGREIEVVERETPTRGNEITILEQFIGNIGRFEDSK